MLRVGQKVLLRAVDSVKGPTKAIKPSRGQKSGLLTSHKFLKAQIQRRHYQKAVEAAKEMAKVFWQGGKELWTNFLESRKLKAKQANGEVLTRAEHRMIRRTNQDIWKLGPLVLINLLPASIIFLGIYVAAVPGALPSTFRIPAWVQKSKEAATAAKKAGSSGFVTHVSGLTKSTPETNEYDHVLTSDVRSHISNIYTRIEKQEYIAPSELKLLNKPFETVMDVVEMDRPVLTSASQLVGLTTFRFMPMPLKIGRLVRHYAYLVSDDKMVLALPEGPASLSDTELQEFLDERGFHPENVPREQQLVWAKDWLTLADDPSVVPSLYILFAASNFKITPNPSAPQPTETITPEQK